MGFKMGVNRSAAMSSKVAGNVSSTCACGWGRWKTCEMVLCGSAREEIGHGDTDACIRCTWTTKLSGHHGPMMVKDPLFLFSSHHCIILVWSYRDSGVTTKVCRAIIPPLIGTKSFLILIYMCSSFSWRTFIRLWVAKLIGSHGRLINIGNKANIVITFIPISLIL